jgi:hypothetical protein
MNLEEDLHNLGPALDRAIEEAFEGVSRSALSSRGRNDWSRRRAAVAALAVAASVAAAVGLVSRLDSRGHNGVDIKTRGTTGVSSPPTNLSTTTSTTTATTTTAQARVALQRVDWLSVVYPIDPHCTGFSPPVSVLQVAYPVPASGVQLAAVLVRCNAGAGTPPSALYVFDGATSTRSPHLLEALVTDADGWQAGSFSRANPVSVNGASMSLTVAGSSSNSVPNCCPDVRATLGWHWTGSHYQLVSAIPPHVTYPALR